MKLKNYFRGTVEAAGKLPRKELGEDALIIDACPAPPEARHPEATEWPARIVRATGAAA